jgi:hypothetical protein
VEHKVPTSIGVSAHILARARGSWRTWEYLTQRLEQSDQVARVSSACAQGLCMAGLLESRSSHGSEPEYRAVVTIHIE